MHRACKGRMYILKLLVGSGHMQGNHRKIGKCKEQDLTPLILV